MPYRCNSGHLLVKSLICGIGGPRVLHRELPGATRMVHMVRCILIAAAVLAPALQAAGEGLIRLADPLDEPEHYCVDVPGFGRRLNLDAPLMAHTCKPRAADETFTVGHPEAGQLYMPAYDRCAEAESREPGARLFVKGCGSSDLQRFSFEPDGRIRLAGGQLCLTVDSADGEPTGGPSHLRRDLALQPCEGASPSLSRWRLP